MEQTRFPLIRLLAPWFYRRDEDITLASGKTLNTNGGNIVVGSGLVDGVDVGTLKTDFDALDTAYDAHVLDGDAHHAQSHALATTSGLGADHTVSGLTSGQVLRATGSTTAAFGAIQLGDLPSTLATDAEVTSAISTHASSSDHDGRYFQKSEFSSSPGAASAPLETGSGGELTLAGDLDVGGSNTIFADVSLNRLGVGTNSPSSRLDVNGTALFTGDVRVSSGLRTGSTSGDAPDGSLVLERRTSTPATDSNAATFYSDGDDLFFVDRNGNLRTVSWT